MNTSFFVRKTMARKPSHFGSKRNRPSGIASSSLASIGSIGGESTRSPPPGEFARLRIHLHLLAFLDEERDSDFESGVERGALGDAAARGVAANGWLRMRNRQLHVWR